MSKPSEAHPLAVSCTDPTLRDKAADLAARFGLSVQPPDASSFLLLTLTPARLELRQANAKQEGPLFVDFRSGAIEHRRKQGGSRGEAIARAVGLKGGRPLTVLDLTAGLGLDSFILAGLGCAIKMVERSPVVAALLADGLERARKDPGLAEIMARIEFINGDSLDITRAWQGARPEVIYLDPMYPPRGKSALVKKEMRLLRLLTGDDHDSEKLLAQALEIALRRVVVKRPRLAPSLTGQAPDFNINGKNSRFDVYIVKDGACRQKSSDFLDQTSRKT